jgi:hypothetical protein
MALADGSERFILRGGKHNGIKVRLYPQNNGWEELVLDGERYVAPSEQDPKKPFLLVDQTKRP